MRIVTIIFSLVFGFLPLAVTGHDHPHAHDAIDQIKAEEIALKSVSNLVEKGKIDKTWQTTKVSKTEQKKFGNDMEWVVSFNNPSAGDPAQKTLYIFLTLGGEYLAANFSGK